MESSGLTESLLTAVTSGTATQSTVGKICHLLHHERSPTLDKPVNRLQSGRVARSTSAKPSRTTSTDCKLSNSQARAFATELATAGAKKLAQARTSQTANSRDALRPSSGNASPEKPSNHSKSTTASQATNAVIAECTHLALDHLRSFVNDKTRWRLLEASLAFVKQLLALKLRDLANTELRACQLLLNAGSTASHQPLLRVELPDTTDAVPLRLALVYQTLIVKAAALSGHPEVINALAKCLQSPGNLPHAIAKRFVDSSSDSCKAAVYLEAISADLLAMCPRLSDSADGTATDPTCSPSPEVVFAIQTYALQLRRIWWHLAKHEIDRAKALSEQFLKITRTYMRRCASQSDEHVLETISRAYVAIFDEATDRVPASQEVRKVIQGANSARGTPYAANNARGAQSDSVRSDLTQLIVDTKGLASATGADIDERLDRFVVCVNEQRTGEKKSLANLTIELSRLIKKQCAGKTATLSRSRTLLAKAVLDFVSWTESVYPGLETRSHQSILLSVLRVVPRRQAANWMSIRIAAVASRGDVLQELAEAARSVNITAAFQISPAAILLGEVLDLLVLHLSTGASTVEITALMEPLIESVSSLQQGIILEWLLRACLKSGGSRPTGALKQLSEQCIQRLYTLYDAQTHPLRRTVVTLQASVALSKGLIDRDLAKRQDLIESNDYGQDVAMQSSLPELRACEKTCQAFESEQDDLEVIQTAIRAWQQLFSKGVAVDLYDRECSTKLSQSLLSFCQARGLSDEAVEVSKQLMRINEQDNTRHARALTAHCEARLLKAASISEYVQQLQRYAGDDNLDTLSRTSCWVVLAETYLATGDLNEAESALTLTTGISDGISGSSKAEQAVLCARAWRVHACICMLQGQLSSAVAAAKTAVSVTNALWQALEQRSISTKTEDDSEINSVAEISSKISKLQLKSVEPIAANARDCGRAYWTLLPLASATLTTLADVYIHAGLFAEAKHHLVKLVEMTEAVPGSLLALMARTKLAELLILAGKTEEAELCLAKVECPAYARDREVAMQMHRVQALLHAKLGEDEDALASLEKAITIANRLSQQATAATDVVEKTVLPKKPIPSKTNRRGPTKKTVKVKSDAIDASTIISQTLDALQIERARLQLKLGVRLDHTEPVSVASMTSAQRQMRHLSAMASLEKDMQTHVVFNALHESTLVWPALESIRQPRTTTTAKTRTGKGRTLKTTAPRADDEPLSKTLAEARSMLAETVSNAEPLMAIHHEIRMLLDSGIYAASSILAQSVIGQQSDLTRLTGAAASLAKRREVQIILQGSQDASSSAKLQWPTKTTRDCNNDATPGLASSLPKSWTAVELMLNENHSALIAVRHRRGQDSLIVRLPFARQDMDDQEDGPFDFEAGRAELQDIIEQSNRICHVGNDSSNRMTSTTWWREREDLDRRLQQLLTNIQEIWFGGFKGILCPSAKRQSELASFRKEFEAILARHVPVGKDVHLSDSMLLLFLDLLHGQTEGLDVDSAVLDLWYGVVDALRFNGYELAYDELDFDSLTVETIDALQNLHDGDEGDAHLILVLDKKLHNFPWESMPYLSHTSVSRMADVDSLQARLAGVESQYCLKPSHGSVILDPSSDMKRTQQTLEPVLKDLRSQHPAWTVMSGKKPTEVEFEQALQTSDLLMYFGHGAGSQYIRPRTIKKLEACSKVVWLMGCSSGEVLEHDELEPASVPAAYLLAADAGPSKCMAIVANLWDVTDKDIDRFSIAMGEDWRLWDGGEVEKPAIKSRARPVLQTPPGSPKTPKVPKARANAVDRSAPPRTRAAVPCNLAQAVSNSRDACYLRYLNGAAPVVYGLPVMLE